MPRSGSSPSRVAPVGRWSRRYLPDSQPPPSGLHGSSPSPASSAAGTISHSISRTSRLYCGCRVTGAGEAERPGQLHGLGQLPAGEVRQAVVADLAGADEAVQRAQRLLQRRAGVEGVHLVEVDRRRRPSRPSDASSARVRCRRGQADAVRANRPIGNRPLVASTTGSVTSAGRSANQRPMICSDVPAE